MAIKDKLVTYGLIGLAIVALAKPLSQLAGSVGSTLGQTFSMGLQDFASQLTGGLIPAAGQGMTGGMMSSMMPAGSMGENPAAAVAVGSGIVAAGMAIKAGAADPLLNLLDPNVPKGSAIQEQLAGIKSFSDLPVSEISNIELSLENAFGTNIFSKIPTIGDQFLNFLKTGATSISEFASMFKFPSGMTLNEILGADTAGISRPILPEAAGFTGMSPQMMMAANLNIDKKIDTPAGVISFGHAAGSVGAGAGAILPAQNLTQELMMHPSLTASQAADLLAREKGTLPSSFDFGSNTGAGLISVFDAKGARVIDSMINPVLAAYEAYKAQYGG